MPDAPRSWLPIVESCVASCYNLPVKSAGNDIYVHRCSYLEQADLVVQDVIVPS